jgi:hypothetical protein
MNEGTGAVNMRPEVVATKPSSKAELFLLLSLAAGWVVGCGSDLEGEVPGESRDAIVGGMIDTTNKAVVAVVTEQGVCSGTIIRRNGDFGYVLTAAHCPGPMYVLETADWNLCFGGGGPCTEYPVDDYAVHPKWPGPVVSPYDVQMVRFTGATNMTHTAPAVQGADGLFIDQSIEISGFGRILGPPGGGTIANSVRHHAFNNVVGFTSTSLFMVQTNTFIDGGGCAGDSGGPIFATVDREKHVVGVINSVDDPILCEAWTGGVRVSNVYASFIVPYLRTH